jgi:hypothetical protein
MCRLEGRNDPIQVAAALGDVQSCQLRCPLLGISGLAHLNQPSLATAQPDLISLASDSFPRLVDDLDTTIGALRRVALWPQQQPTMRLADLHRSGASCVLPALGARRAAAT